MISNKVLTAGEAREITNGVGLSRASWNGSLFSLILEDGTAIEIKSVLDGSGIDIDPIPILHFTHNRLRVTEPIEKY